MRAVTFLVFAGLIAGGSAPVEPPAGVKADAPPMESLCGIFACEGEDAQGKTYAGAVTIQKLGTVYLVQWIVRGTSTTGIGVRVGDSLAVGWTLKETRGVTLYAIGKDRLAGRWASLPGELRPRRETLIFLRALPPLED